VMPPSLLETNARGRGAEGLAWAESLPGVVAACAERWGLRLEPPYPELSYNYAAPVRLRDGQPVVLKVCFPDGEMLTEVAALRLFDGDGAVRLIEADPTSGAMLLERLEPGTLLSTEPNDERATAIAARLALRLHRRPPTTHPFPTMAEWLTRAAEQSRADMARRGEAEPVWLAYALAVDAELRADAPPAVVLHGDLHHFNVLAAREPWLAIDPKGVVGEPGYEVGPWLENRAERWPDDDAAARRHLARLLDQLAEALAFDRQRLTRAAFVRVALSEMWTLEGEGPSAVERFARDRLRCLRLLEEMVRASIL
jgi:streptomycin 6-kinase